MASLTLTSIDWDQAGAGRPDLIETTGTQLPAIGRLRKVLPGPDRPDYFVCSLDHPIRFRPDATSDAESSTDHLVFAALFSGESLHQGMAALPVRVAFVTDPTLLDDDRLDFAKCEYIGQGFVSDLPEDYQA